MIGVNESFTVLNKRKRARHKKLTILYIVIYKSIDDNIGAGSNTLFTHVIELTFKRTVSSPTMRHNIAPRSSHLISDETRGIFYKVFCSV